MINQYSLPEFNQIHKLEKSLLDFRIKCDCSHTFYIFPSDEKQFKICSHCGKKVYRNEKEKFKETLLKKIRRKK